MVQIMCQYLDCLPDLLSCMCASHEMRDVASAVAGQRFNDIIGPFVGAHGAEMRHLLHITTTLITGSCATKMLMGGNGAPNNLNLITPFESADVLYAYIVSDLQYERVDTDATPHPAFGDSDFKRVTCTLQSLRLHRTDYSESSLPRPQQLT